MEDFVRDCWVEILGYDTFEDDRPFFEVGGNSIKLMKLRALYAKNNYQASIVELFQAPTVKLQAMLLLKN